MGMNGNGKRKRLCYNVCHAGGQYVGLEWKFHIQLEKVTRVDYAGVGKVAMGESLWMAEYFCKGRYSQKNRM